ncbi:hypothetical protein F511_09644 [Dorcoceras hygrometricum]|uniref:Uncharacterized protein n=1 Tax=Dorcoceras hygrometricum TaxID=472368 RepID=A0A2Z7D8Z7_9LAMI|nr:hypothetical protein F511_09644 [Dorcoceras hygrometricum]
MLKTNPVPLNPLTTFFYCRSFPELRYPNRNNETRTEAHRTETKVKFLLHHYPNTYRA